MLIRKCAVASIHDLIQYDQDVEVTVDKRSRKTGLGSVTLLLWTTKINLSFTHKCQSGSSYTLNTTVAMIRRRPQQQSREQAVFIITVPMMLPGMMLTIISRSVPSSMAKHATKRPTFRNIESSYRGSHDCHAATACPYVANSKAARLPWGSDAHRLSRKAHPAQA
jgi:hypothetical protein